MTEPKIKLETIEVSWDVQQVRWYQRIKEETLKDHSFTTWVYFVEKLALVDRADILDFYSILTFKPLHVRFLGF